MKFEVFDRDAAEAVPDGPLVCVDRVGRLLFNRPAWEFLVMQARPGAVFEVSLGFDAETRTVAVQPLVTQDGPPGTRWVMQTMRSLVWPCGVAAKVFVEHYQIGLGEYPARLLRGPGPRMVTFEAGPPQRPQVGTPPGSVLEEEPGIVGTS